MPDQQNISEVMITRELVNYLRNKDIFSTTLRGVVTGSDTGSITSSTTITLTRSNAKNIRSVVVAAVTLVYGRDYMWSGTNTITLTTARTGSYTVTYDYGNTDKIFPDLPQNLTALADFPRIGLQWLGATTGPGGFGLVDVSTVEVRISVYAFGSDDLAGYLDAVRAALRADKANFWYLGSYVQVTGVGPRLLEDLEVSKKKLMHQNIDIEGRLRYEK